jgi:hypothetical protein
MSVEHRETLCQISIDVLFKVDYTMILVYEKPAGECTRLVEIKHDKWYWINETNDIHSTVYTYYKFHI